MGNHHLWWIFQMEIVIFQFAMLVITRGYISHESCFQYRPSISFTSLEISDLLEPPHILHVNLDIGLALPIAA